MVEHENTAMRREALFSRDGFYSFVVQSNALLHHEAVETGVQVLRSLLHGRDPGSPVAVLDLACGGEPIALAEMLAACPEHQFHYHGIDINPDQVEAAQAFAYPANVVRTRIDEASAWDLQGLEIERPYDLVFMGMNLHHGTPEEILFLARELRAVISPHGVFMNHDWFRPDEQPYHRRPDCNPDRPSESYRLVEPARLAQAPGPVLDGESEYDGAEDSSWRVDFRTLLDQRLLECGAEQTGANATHEHVASRDYPISLREFALLFGQQNFQVHTLRYAGDEPLKRYIAMPVASLDAAVIRRLRQPTA